MKKVLKCVVFIGVLILTGCSKKYTVEVKEIPLALEEVLKIISCDDIGWYAEQNYSLSDNLTAMTIYTRNKDEIYGNDEHVTEADKTVGILTFYKSTEGQKVGFQFIPRYTDNDVKENIFNKGILVCCDMYYIDAYDTILEDIKSDIKLVSDVEYDFWYKEYDSVYCWLEYRIIEGEIFPLVFSISDGKIHNDMLANKTSNNP